MSPDPGADPLMSIGTFSRASLVSIRALRSYHDQGLLVPDSVDAATGYRSYRVSQLADAQIIKRLREMDVPLRQVAEVLQARDPVVTRRVLAQHETVMRERLASIELVVDELNRTVERPELHTPVHLRDVPETSALAVRDQIPIRDVARFLGRAYALIFEALISAGSQPSGPGGALYAADFPDEVDDVTAFIPVGVPIVIDDHIVTNATLPAGTFAVLTHVGGYDSIDATYRQLGAWVARNTRPLDAPIREHYVVSVDEATGSLLPAEQLRTEIAWPVAATDSTTPP